MNLTKFDIHAVACDLTEKIDLVIITLFTVYRHLDEISYLVLLELNCLFQHGLLSRREGRIF